MLRRATIDLTGLPPTPEERAGYVRAHEADAEAAWDALIDRLLATPAYGEAWGRHWLDQVRYAETNGYERDATKTNIWRYRDWVIRAHNSDMPYDRFLTEQLADEFLQSVAIRIGADQPRSDFRAEYGSCHHAKVMLDGGEIKTSEMIEFHPVAIGQNGAEIGSTIVTVGTEAHKMLVALPV